MFRHHRHSGLHGGCGLGAMRGSRHWGPFSIEWELRDERGGGRGRARRFFSGDELRLLLLKLIEPAPSHGYDLIRAIEEMSGGAYVPSPGVIYPTLTLLADMDLIAEQQSEGARKVVAITPAGEAYLAERAEEAAALLDRLKGLGEMRARADNGPVRRAMGNLKAALQNRLRGESEDTELPHAIAAILDEAVQKIERL